jgi:hypothetical protein
MKSGSSDSNYSDDEIARRRDDVIRRMANTSPKPHSEMKIGKRKAKTSPRGLPPKKGPGNRTEPQKLIGY